MSKSKEELNELKKRYENLTEEIRELSEDGIAEIGYGIAEEYRGCGYAAEAVSAAVDWALGQTGVMCITAEAEEVNIASQKVLSKAGFVPTGEVGEEGPLYVRCK